MSTQVIHLHNFYYENSIWYLCSSKFLTLTIVELVILADIGFIIASSATLGKPCYKCKNLTLKKF